MGYNYIMPYNQNIKNEVIKLRKAGKTYSEIQTTLDIKIPKSTLSEWCNGIVMPSWYQEKINKLNHLSLNKAQRASYAVRQFRQEEWLKKLALKNKHLKRHLNNKMVLKMILAMLYLGEGSKWKSHRGLMLGSSDPLIIQLYTQLLKACYNIKPESLKCRISYRADQNIKELERFWAKVVNISLDNFYKTKSDPRTIGKKTQNLDYKGVCVLMCGGTEIQLELEIIAKEILKGL